MENSFEIITSKDNPNLKLYSRLAGSKKERLQYQSFVLEGYRLVKDAVCENISFKSLMFTKTAYEKYGSEFSQADLKGVKLLIISNELGMKISSTEKTQGIFAICNIPAERDFTQCVKKNGKYAVLYQLQDPGNVGMIIRTADALGIDGVILCKSVDLYSPKVVRSTMGSLFRIPVWTNIDDEDRLFCAFKENNIETFAAVIDKDAKSLRECSFNDGGAVFIGNEGNGLPPDISNTCDTKVTIKMSGNANSLNAAMATGIVMWEMSAR